ncbi:MAG: N-(5'-phosphoribosyl)anthranilate isomerase [Campylobacteraceae bacterium 4484_4]|nr:MAG: N-(5'-phosphoribosyl)anthranilate isomerase [Campylobacteraceae bacterium 4484_4]
MLQPRVKICGITNLQDALDAVDAGADALGFVFYPQSPRYITPDAAVAIVAKLPPFIERVGLFVEESADDIDLICRLSRMSLAQIHFDAPSELYEKLHTPYLRVIRARSREDLQKEADSYRLVDAFVESYGGEGKRIESSWFEGIDCSKIILAGGLDPKNVLLLRKYGFFGYDVSSGVEKAKGKKDKMKMQNFCKAVKYGKI